MWLFRKRIKWEECNLFRGFTDWHSHILPGVDDGVQACDESLQILARYKELGIKEVWLTPHIMEEIANSTDGLRKKFRDLCMAYQGDIILHLASENMLDNLFEKRLNANDLLPLGEDGKYLLVETSYFNPPMALNNIFLRIKAKGYIPVLAHPERYQYMDESAYRELKTLNVKFQLNLSSLTGSYGIIARKKARNLLKKGLYEFCGSDIHSIASLELMLNSKPSHKDIQLINNINK